MLVIVHREINGSIFTWLRGSGLQVGPTVEGLQVFAADDDGGGDIVGGGNSQLVAHQIVYLQNYPKYLKNKKRKSNFT